jgi:hypothetical protein
MNEILEQLRTLMEKGTEEQVRAFVGEHFAELPEDVQKEFAVALFREAIDEEIQEREAIVKMKEEAVRMIDEVENTN